LRCRWGQFVVSLSQGGNNLAPFIGFADFVGIAKYRPPVTVEPHGRFDFLDIPATSVEYSALGVTIEYQRGVCRTRHFIGT
jgi:hypothetical protein